MGHNASFPRHPEEKLSAFRKKKLLYEFNTFYDLNKDGAITEVDFHMVRQHICRLNGWAPGTEKYERIEELFRDIWTSLRAEADTDGDEKVTAEEWVRMWERLDVAMGKKNSQLPQWLTTYMWYRFNMYDRTGNGQVDVEEFAYVLEHFGVPARQSSQCFLMVTKDNTLPLDFAYFCKLAMEYHFSNDPCALGNFVTGRLEF